MEAARSWISVLVIDNDCWIWCRSSQNAL